MAEAVVFSLASKILSTIATLAFNKAYERGLSIWEARDELDKLQVTIETIHAVLLDAEKQQENSVAVKNLITRLKGVLYDADDLFDEVATDDLLKQQMKKGNYMLSLIEKVLLSCSKLNPIVSRDSIAKQVKAIRESLSEISTVMDGMGFVSCAKEEGVPNGMAREDSGWFVDAKAVIGRDEDKKAILEMLFNESVDAPVVIAIVGIGGMGKTTLAQLIYSDDEVKRSFDKKWFACISDTTITKEILGKIFQAICKKSYSDVDVGQMQTKITKSIKGRKFLLVLDDVWDDNHGRWQNRMSLLGSAAKGSKIIVTTRSLEVAKAIEARTHTLNGLSGDDSLSLFKRVAFSPEKENDPRWTDLGREIVKKCRNVPLAINSIGSLLYEKDTVQEWESFKDEELSKLWEQGGDNIIMNTLKLSYEHLSSSMKHCFAYCSLYPKDEIYQVNKLIYLWIAQGYINPDNDQQRIEQKGKSCFMYLLRRGFFQEAEENEYGEIESCKMHDLIHDLAQHVAGKESIFKKSSDISNCVRHVSTGNSKIDEPWAIPPSLLNANRLRSCLLFNGAATFSPTLPLDQVFANFKRLRALTLTGLDIVNVPSSIGELKHLRCLDLSWNKFESLPHSLTDLLNLITLDITGCEELKALPEDLRKLINLRNLSITGCWSLSHMPPGMGEMTCLQHLSDFKVGKATSKKSGQALAGLVQQLRGELTIEFEDGIEDWDGDEGWKPPAVCLQRLKIFRYPAMRIPEWVSNGGINNLAYLNFFYCRKVTNLPPLRCLPGLKRLDLRGLMELEFVEDGDSCTTVAGSLFFPRLEWLELGTLPKLKGWSREVAATTSSTPSVLLSFPLLSRLTIARCPELKSFPLCPRLQKLEFQGINEEIDKLLSNTSNSSLASTTPSSSSSSFQQILISPHLQSVLFLDCDNLEIMHLAPPNLRQLTIRLCGRLKKLHIVHPNAIEKLQIVQCKQLELWEAHDNRIWHLDWDSFTNLRVLVVKPLPPSEKLPQCLRDRQARGQLQITEYWLEKTRNGITTHFM